MKNASEHVNRLNHLLKELRKKAEVNAGKPDRDPVQQLIHGFLTWDATHAAADQAFGRLTKSMVDLNDLRVTDPAELAASLGPRYPRVQERSTRLVRALQAIYIREHVVDLSKLAAMPKREARAYLEGLEGMTPHVAAGVCLLTLDAHAIPVDDQLHANLVSEGVVEADSTLAETQAFLEHHIPAADAIEAYHLLRAWLERPIKVDLPRSRSRATTKKPTKKTPSKKAPTKKTPTKKSPSKKKPTRR